MSIIVNDAQEQLNALAWAAREAGTSYGKFVQGLSKQEKADIVKAYRAWRQEQLLRLRRNG